MTCNFCFSMRIGLSILMWTATKVGRLADKQMRPFTYNSPGYYSWKRLGDVVSSMYALGYHQQADGDTDANPSFLLELRRLAVATTFSADKNVSIFLGRPPRMPRKYCKFILPRSSEVLGASTITTWENDVEFDYITDIRWASLCAILKEDILDLSSSADINDNHPKVR